MYNVPRYKSKRPIAVQRHKESVPTLQGTI